MSPKCTGNGMVSLLTSSLTLILLLLPQSSKSHALGWSLDTEYASTAARELKRTWIVRVLALVCSALSMLASMITFFWFIRMEKRFRHRLIMLLIFGDVMRAVWFFAYAASALARGQVGTQSSFCQSSGFFIQYGTETTDYAVLVIAIHSALQVFNPSKHVSSDGLYRYRVYVYIGAVIIPSFMAGFAFVNPTFGYLTVGAFCVLPLRPFWYRLALMWVPRYLIASIVIGLAVAIYAYVGFEFRKYSKHSVSIDNSILSTAADTTNQSTNSRADVLPIIVVPETEAATLYSSTRNSSLIEQPALIHRRGSAVSFLGVEPLPEDEKETVIKAVSAPKLLSDSRLLNMRTTDVRLHLPIIPSGDSVQPATTNDDAIVTLSPTNIDQVITRLNTAEGEPEPLKTVPLSRNASIKTSTQHHMDRQRARIHRQLRLLFIYPLIYTLVWLLPFVQHCTNYRDKYVSHPIWWLRCATVICMTVMGFVDCLIFSLREKPWQSISTSDGTLWGSFAVFRGTGRVRHASPAGSEREAGTSVGGPAVRDRMSTQQSVMERMSRFKSNVRMSSSGHNRAQIALGEARARLELEKEDRLAAARSKISSHINDEDDGIEWERGIDEHIESPLPEEGCDVEKGEGRTTTI